MSVKTWSDSEIEEFYVTSLVHNYNERGADIFENLGAEENERVYGQQACLHVMVQYGFFAGVKKLIELGLNPNGCNKFMSPYGCDDELANPPLVLAVLEGHVDICRLLIDHGADVNARSVDDDPVLNICCSDNLQIVRFVLAAGPDSLAKGVRGHTALHSSCYSSTADIMLALLEHAKSTLDAAGFVAFMNMRNEFNDTALYTSVLYRHYAGCQLLLDHGAIFDASGPQSIVNLAAKSNSLGLVRLFLSLIPAETDKCKAVNSAELSMGYTALHWAAWAVAPDLILELLEAGADPNILDRLDRTPYDCLSMKATCDDDFNQEHSPENFKQCADLLLGGGSSTKAAKR